MKQALEEQLTVEAAQVGDFPCLRLRGDADRAGARLLREALSGLLALNADRALVDTRNLRFLDLHCCKVLEEAAARFQERGGVLVVVDSSLPVERTLKLLDVEHLVPVLPSIPQALDLLEQYE